MAVGENTTCKANLVSGDSISAWYIDGVQVSGKEVEKTAYGNKAGKYIWKVVTTKGASNQVTLIVTQGSSGSGNSDPGLNVILPSGTQYNTIYTYGSGQNKFFSISMKATNAAGTYKFTTSSQPCFDFEGTGVSSFPNVAKGTTKTINLKYKNKGSSTLTITFTPTTSGYKSASKTVNIVCQ